MVLLVFYIYIYVREKRSRQHVIFFDKIFWDIFVFF
jgi:hypothetical protein